MSVFTPTQVAALGDLCDTFVPGVRPPAVEASDPTGFWGRRATDLRVHEVLADELERRLSATELDETRKVLDLLGVARFGRLPQRIREGMLTAMSAASRDAADGLAGLRSLTLYLFYGTVDDAGTNPNWTQSGYPGPPATTSSATAPAVHVLPPDDEIVLDADVVIVGSGAGGGVMAGELASAGLSVVVLEAGGRYDDADFPPDEYRAMRDLYWRGGLTPTHDGNVAMLAGATLGGGSTINWQNCVAPPPLVREQWAEEHGLTGLVGETFDAHLHAVRVRIGATTDHTDLNGPNQRLADGAAKLGVAWHTAARNVSSLHDPVSAGHVGYGDRSGAKQGTLKTYLADAVEHDARIVVGCRVDRVLVENGRAAGVTASLDDGRTVTVHAPDVVVAAGALETPGVLLRSRIGGNAVGQYLRLHPVPMMVGVYREPQEPWWGPPQAVVVDEYTDVMAGHGYLVETAHSHPGITGLSIPWRSGRDHKLMMGRSGSMAAFIAVQRDHGSGHVVLDAAGETQIHYPLQDSIDAEVSRHAIRRIIDLHVAAGASTVLDLHPDRAVWRRGDDVDKFADAAAARPLGHRERVLFSAHQMGSARMGRDPRTSVAGPDGQLHTTKGVWIGDTSAFPTAVGSNPMLTCMAMARRSAHALLAQR